MGTINLQNVTNGLKKNGGENVVAEEKINDLYRTDEAEG
jgi:hypothetical protein